MNPEIKICLTAEDSNRDKLYAKYKFDVESQNISFRDLLNTLDLYLSILEDDIKRDCILSSSFSKTLDFSDYDDYFDNIYALNRLLREKFHSIDENTSFSSKNLEENNLPRDLAAMNAHIHFLENRIRELEYLPSVRSHLLKQDEQSVLELKEKVTQNEQQIHKLEQKLKDRSLSSKYYHDCFINSCNQIDELKKDLVNRNSQISALHEQLSKQVPVSVQESLPNDNITLSYSRINVKTFFITIASIIISIVIGVMAIHFNCFGLFLSIECCYFFVLYILTIDTESANPFSMTIGTLTLITITVLLLVYFLNHSSYVVSHSSDNTRSSYSYNSSMVWVDDTAKRYHKKNDCGMDNAYQVTLEEAEAMGKTPCGNCYR